ncbi:MAG TPA: outer membrane protein assembly factor BamA [Candidatus Acidoferrum sp.]|nr:outer membrane protein assembly factor BamA [Candidatus Acidoferrum sp.]
MCFGGAALKTSTAAYSRVCLPFGVLASRATWIAAALLFFAASSPAATHKNLLADASASAAPGLSSFSSDSSSDDSALTGEPQASTQAPNGQPQFVIERIEFIGNRRIRSDTLKARIFSREGDPYNEETLRRDFQALWNTQFFEDVKLRVEDSPDRADAKIIIFEVRERPQIRRIRYEGIHSVTESDILDRFKERKVGLSVESPFDPTKIKKAEVVLKELLGEHGRQFAKVTPQYERIASSNAVILVFKIVEGPKVKVGKIKFVGNHAFSDRKLIRSMRHDRPYGIPLYFWDIPVLSKTYDREKLNEDLEVGVRGLYQDNGYFRVVVAPNGPILENKDVVHHGVPVPGLRPHTGKAVNITIKIEEGERYRMGTLKIVSSDPDKALSLKVEPLKALFPLKEGDILDVDKLRKALKNYTDAYGQYGFIDFTAEPDFDIDDAAKKINLTLRFDEQKQYYVHRINFSGNTTTRDKVIRRELLIDEGQLFNKRFWDISVLRLNQLNYFDKIDADKAVELQKNTKDGTVDINLKLKEKGKQSIGLQGGVSGLAGGFIGLTYQTNNFLGLGETLTLSAQFGEIERILQFGFTEPYLFDRPISTGFTVFSSKYNFNQAKQEALLYGQQVSVNPQFVQNYDQNSTGFTAFASYPMKRFSFARFGLSYGLTRTNITAFNQASSLLFEQLQFRAIAGPSALNGIISSSITPSISYNTIDNPINATKGKSIYYSLSFQGGPLGGNVNTFTNVFDIKYFHPINKRRNAIGLHFTTAYVTGFGGKEVPPFSRFYMGGENDIRGFDIRSISPVVFIPTVSAQPLFYHDPLSAGTLRSFNLPVLVYTATLPGGDFQASGNIEYRIPIAGPVSMALFADAGTDGILRTDALHLDPTGIANITANFPIAPLTKTLGIASGTNFRLRDSAGIEFGVNLPIVQAPFRIYYAYNLNRLYSQISAPNPFVNQGTLNTWRNTLDGLSPNLWESQIAPQLGFLNNPGRLNYFEPKTTFRFTVGKTF